MTKAEEIRLHNLFIKFKNEGKQLDEIGRLLAIDKKLLENWNSNFETESNKIKSNNSSIAKSVITGIDENENYQYSHSVSFNLDELSLAKFNLARIVNNIEEGSPENNLQKNAKKYFFRLF